MSYEYKMWLCYGPGTECDVYHHDSLGHVQYAHGRQTEYIDYSSEVSATPAVDLWIGLIVLLYRDGWPLARRAIRLARKAIREKSDMRRLRWNF